MTKINPQQPTKHITSLPSKQRLLCWWSLRQDVAGNALGQTRANEAAFEKALSQSVCKDRDVVVVAAAVVVSEEGNLIDAYVNSCTHSLLSPRVVQTLCSLINERASQELQMTCTVS